MPIDSFFSNTGGEVREEIGVILFDQQLLLLVRQVGDNYLVKSLPPILDEPIDNQMPEIQGYQIA